MIIMKFLTSLIEKWTLIESKMFKNEFTFLKFKNKYGYLIPFFSNRYFDTDSWLNTYSIDYFK